jgi:hypothetical protein
MSEMLNYTLIECTVKNTDPDHPIRITSISVVSDGQIRLTQLANQPAVGFTDDVFVAALEPDLLVESGATVPLRLGASISFSRRNEIENIRFAVSSMRPHVLRRTRIMMSKPPIMPLAAANRQ